MVEWLTTEAVGNIDVTLGAMNSCSGLLYYPWAFSRMVAWEQYQGSYCYTGKTQVVK